MHFIATADTDIGIVKNTNQDSLLVKYATCSRGDVLMAIICDGMGGLQKGELASATVIREFDRWFVEELPFALERANLDEIGKRWAQMLTELNERLMNYSLTLGNSLGTTFSGILFIDDEYLIVHVGDTRIYHIGSSITQLTTDQTFVQREVMRGNMTPQQAKIDKRRNLLLQCVGASKVVVPQIIRGSAEAGAYMICCDGFRHEIDDGEIYDSLNPINLLNKESMHANARYLIEQNKKRGERDNISIILIKAE